MNFAGIFFVPLVNTLSPKKNGPFFDFLVKYIQNYKNWNTLEWEHFEIFLKFVTYCRILIS